MQNTQRLWRSLLFILLFAAMCGSLVFPIVDGTVEAAPKMQATSCLGTTVSEWDFTGNVVTTSLGNGTLSYGIGLGAPTYPAGQSASEDPSISFNGFENQATFDANDYIEFAVPTVGRTGILISFKSRVSNTGPAFFDVYYSTDGANFIAFDAPYVLNNDATWYTLSLDFSAIPQLNDNLNAKFRLYGYSASSSAGTWRLDNVTFIGNCIFPADTPTSTPSPTHVPPLSVVINEVAWSGTAAGSTDEWFELHNTTAAPINLAGWRLEADDGNPNFALSGTIDPGDYFVVARAGGVFNDLVPDLINSSFSFENAGEVLILLDPNGNQVDTANVDDGAWPAGQGSPTFASMERQGVVPDSPASWITYGGTVPVAHDRNGNDIKGTPGQANWISIVTLTPTPTISPTPTITSTATGPLGVIINEVAWPGTSAATTDDEWIELFNPGTLPVDITGWSLYGDDNTVNKVGSPNITLKGTIPAGEYFLLEKTEQATTVSADQVYSTGDLNNGGERLYLKNSAGTVIDTANLDGGAWPAGTASVTTTSPPPYASMERVAGTTSTWVTYSGTVPVAYDRNGGPIKGTPGNANWISSVTITTITSDLPDPSLVNRDVTVVVSVIGGRTIPSGKVNITGANTNCSITLSANGTGSCMVRFSSIGAKTLIAAYTGDTTHAASSDTEPHQVSTSTTIIPTAIPTAAPPPPLLAINEFVPRPGHDWNNDGVVNVSDEYIEVLNHGVVNVNLSGYSLDDEVNVGSSPYSLPALTLRPGERYVFYGSETGILLGDGGDGVRLLKPNGQLADAYNYTIVERPDQSFCRLPDNGGADDWDQNCYPTPGVQNSLSAQPSEQSGNATDLYCPIADTLPDDFAEAECEPFGNNIWRPEFWDQTGWYGDQVLPGINTKWPVFAN